MAIDENGKVTFTAEEQVEVDRIVGERLGRERARYADYEDLKDLPEILSEFGYSGTPAEIKQAVKEHAAEYRKQAELEALQAEAKNTGTTPELLSEMKELKKELAEIKQEKEARQQAMQAQVQADQMWDAQVNDFVKKYPNVDLEKLNNNDKFLRFVRGKQLPLAELYEDFVDLVGGAESDAIAKLQSNIDRSTSSGRQRGDAPGGTYGLTPRQQQLAKDGGMTLKEYSEILGHIKK